MKLKKVQREALLKWIAEGLESAEINKRAAKFKPPFEVLRSQVVYYRQSRGVNLQTIQAEGEVDALRSGFAIRENRVATLQKLADKMESDLLGGDKMWLLQVKGIGRGDDFERVEYWEFNRSEMESLRGVLDDIAAEVGERIRTTAITNPDGSLKPETMKPSEIAARVAAILGNDVNRDAK